MLLVTKLECFLSYFSPMFMCFCSWCMFFSANYFEEKVLKENLILPEYIKLFFVTFLFPMADIIIASAIER